MPSPNNLRIISENWIDLSTTTISASSTASNTSVSNLKSDTKSVVWRSTTGTQASIIVDFGVNTTRTVGGVVLAFSNIPSSTATMRIVGYTQGNTPGFSGALLNTNVTTTFNSGTIQCCPWNNLSLPAWGTTPSGSSNYSYGGGTYARAWLDSVVNSTTPVRYIGIEIIDSSNTAGYIEVSRLIVGNYWSATYNTSYGIQSGIKDLSEHVRTESGDLLTRRGPRFKILNFDLQWMTDSDRREVTRIFMGNGLPKPLFVSLFPNSTGVDADYQRENNHQLYGKMVQIPGVSYTNFEIYSTNIELEEV